MLDVKLLLACTRLNHQSAASMVHAFRHTYALSTYHNINVSDWSIKFQKSGKQDKHKERNGMIQMGLRSGDLEDWSSFDPHPVLYELIIWLNPENVFRSETIDKGVPAMPW